MAASKKTATLAKVATIARPNQMAILRDRVLYVMETKVSADYREAFPDATAAKLVRYDLSDPKKPVRTAELVIYAPWWIVAPREPGVIFVAAVAEGSEPPQMVIHAVDTRARDALTIAATIPTEAKYVAESREPVFAICGTHLLFCSRADAKLHVYSIASPLAPTKVAELTLPSTPQAGFADDEGALITQLGNSEPVLDVRGRDATWTITPRPAFTGSERVVRWHGRYYAPSGDHHNYLAWYGVDFTKAGETKLGPTSIHIHLDAAAGRLVTTGDHLSVWGIGDDGAPVLAGRGKEPGLYPARVTAHDVLVCVPERPNTKATDKQKTFALSLWSIK